MKFPSQRQWSEAMGYTNLGNSAALGLTWIYANFRNFHYMLCNFKIFELWHNWICSSCDDRIFFDILWCECDQMDKPVWHLAYAIIQPMRRKDFDSLLLWFDHLVSWPLVKEMYTYGNSPFRSIQWHIDQILPSTLVTTSMSELLVNWDLHTFVRWEVSTLDTTLAWTWETCTGIHTWQVVYSMRKGWALWLETQYLNKKCSIVSGVCYFTSN